MDKRGRQCFDFFSNLDVVMQFLLVFFFIVDNAIENSGHLKFIIHGMMVL